MSDTDRTPTSRPRRAGAVTLLAIGLVTAASTGADAYRSRATDDDQRIEFGPGTEYGSVAGIVEAPAPSPTDPAACGVDPQAPEIGANVASVPLHPNLRVCRGSTRATATSTDARR